MMTKITTNHLWQALGWLALAIVSSVPAVRALQRIHVYVEEVLRAG